VGITDGNLGALTYPYILLALGLFISGFSPSEHFEGYDVPVHYGIIVLGILIFLYGLIMIRIDYWIGRKHSENKNKLQEAELEEYKLKSRLVKLQNSAKIKELPSLTGKKI